MSRSTTAEAVLETIYALADITPPPEDVGRAQTTYGDAASANPTFGQVVAVGAAASAIPSLANIDPPRMFQFQVRVEF